MPNISESKLFNPDPKTILIIGNGFDLDLNMKTSYSSFANNQSYWPFNSSIYQKEGTLSRFLNDKKEIERWFDLEEALSEYATTHHIYQNICEDKECYSLLVTKLQEYLKNEQANLSLTECVPAAKVILDIVLKKKEYYIYSFNYTNLQEIAQKMMINIDPKRVQYVHGSLKNNDIILGTGDVADLPDEYSWLYKSFNPSYRANNLVEDLSDADEVYIFGHSLGRNDYDYFFDFFHAAIQERTKRFIPKDYSKIKLRIFTKDEESELSINRQLRVLTDKHLQGLYAHCDFEILHTMGEVNWFHNDNL